MCFEQFCVSSSLQFFCSLYLSRSLVKSNKWHRLRCNGNDCMWYLFILFILSHHTLLIDRMYWTRTFNQSSNSLTECTQYSSFIFRISNNYSIIITIYLKDTHRGNGEHDCKGQAYERGAFVRTISDLIALQTMTDYLCCIESKLQHKHGQQIALSVRMLFWRFFFPWIPAAFWSTHCELCDHSWCCCYCCGCFSLYLSLSRAELVVGVDVAHK